jgi:hypothetical protein
MLMKQIALLLCLWAGLSQASAQVSVEVTLDQDQFLPGETLIAGVRISNRSGQPLRFGTDDDWLTFSVESKDGLVVARTGDVPVLGEFVVDSSKRATKHVDLAPYFAFSKPGRYTITATVKIKDWGKETASPQKNLNIVEGAHLWEQEFGLPKSSAPGDGEPEVRKYMLQQVNYLKGQLRLYVRVTDAPGTRIFRTVPVGTMLSFSQPDTRLDKDSKLHLLYQSWARSFSYSVFNPDGEMILRQTYDFKTARPRFAVDADGNISIAGGERRVSQSDIPAPALSVATENPKPR